jgi:ectoine hydroxylase-related dioxygenase (phytanoyl-CoA dioxygenase family)
MLIDNHVRELAHAAEEQARALEAPTLNATLTELVRVLRERCGTADARARYANCDDVGAFPTSFPIRADGYAEAIDPLDDEESFYDCWRKFGIVVGKDVVPQQSCEAVIARLHDVTKRLSADSCDLSNPDTYHHMPVDPSGVPLLSRGFFELYHDQALAQIRQAVRLYIQHVVMWGRSDLWTSFDRVGVKLPSHDESKALPLHVDQNPLLHPDFRTTQGVLALSDCPAERGTFVGVPASRMFFKEYGRMAGRGDYVELRADDTLFEGLTSHAQAIPIRAGHVISWDSRTTHANSENVSDRTRYVAYVSAGPVPTSPETAYELRRDAFATGIGSNERDALMHASKRPRFNNPEALAAVREPEDLTSLGRLLYGDARYEDL